MNRANVSIIIPTRNRPHLIIKSIQSILSQTYQDFEIIVVDGSDGDDTEKVVKNFNDPRIRYIKDEKNKGPAAARNIGIGTAKGEYIAFQDDDDEWVPEKLEKQMKAFKNAPPEVGVIYTGFWRIKNDKKTYIPSNEITQKEGNIHNILLKGNFVDTPAAVVRKDCFKKVGLFDESLPALEDWELFIRISKVYSFKCIDEPLFYSYFTLGSVNTNKRNTIKALELILEKHNDDFKQIKKVLANHYFGLSSGLSSLQEFRQGRKYLLKAFRAYPLSIKITIAVVISLLGQSIYNKAVAIHQKIKTLWSKGW